MHSTQPMPDVWGAGQLLAFSGIDGATDLTRPFVWHTGSAPGEFILRLPVEASLCFRGLDRPAVQCLLGDVGEMVTASGPFRFAFLDQHTMAGELPAGVRLELNGRVADEKGLGLELKPGVMLLACRRGNRWAVLIDYAGAVKPRLEAALAADLDAAAARRKAYVESVPMPAGLSAARQRLLRKAVSVMKVNVESSCGRIGRRWTTPDRWPHRMMWLWDSAFHAVGFAAIDPAMARDAVLAMIEQIDGDGFLPHMVRPEGEPSAVTQPPILAWALSRVLARTPDRDWARACLEPLRRQLAWVGVNRDRNGNGIPEWLMEGNVDCRSGESGADNSPRFDGGLPLDAPDYAGYLCHDWQCLADMAASFGEGALAAACRGEADRVARAVNALLWSEADRFYLERGLEGGFVDVKTATGFVPLFAGIPDPARAAALRDHLSDPRTFGSPVPIPSVALDSGTFCKDMWRGPAWINLNYMTALGLRRYGFEAEAERLKEASLTAVEEGYAREGCLFEFFDSLGLTTPRALDRKRRLSTGRGIAPISDYHWTAALTAAWLLE